MIVAQVNIPKKQITLLSVPRDIFFNGRKINSAHYYYGIDELKRQLAIITGYHIDRYVLIDMSAFADMIDYLYGIYVYLEEPLIDPSYKTFDFGEWETLYYEKGTHHLSGVQALRVARSRGTTSDFSRAKRQQAILVGIKNKLKRLSVNDVGRISRIIQVALKKVQTNMELKELLSYYLRFKDYTIRKGYVLTTRNVLKYKYQTLPEEGDEPEKCYKQLLGSQKVIEIKCAPLYVGQYILLPEKDWNAVRWYVKGIFEN
jgi:LCP family protein required for cell wall assembly